VYLTCTAQVSFAIGLLKKGVAGGMLSGMLFQYPGLLMMSVIGFLAERVDWTNGMYADTHTYTHVCVCMCTCVYMCIYTHLHICIYTHGAFKGVASGLMCICTQVLWELRW
jgi:hypothetical protein